ncbi:IS3 family transposase [Pseudomonas aeruginosa]|uniref:IS3 family transposase n=1 Tax=Pseudomonas aeruginosa TaxID=287 RepID=UPI001D0F6590|nr:IS3 family transposase [Pseudomonas aeruginosa]
MARYSIEHREWVVRQMMPPLNRTVPELVEATGITDATLYAWRKQARAAGAVVPGDGQQADQWSSQDKFRVVLESASLNAAELAEYCRRKGLYVEQINAWREACEQANSLAQPSKTRREREEEKAAKKRIKQLERELRRKDAALAETAALLVLRKKAEALWGRTRGRMISAPDRRETLQLIEDAVAAGARRAQACAELGLSLRSLQRWQHCPEDRRPSAQRAEPANKLTPQERRRVLEVANQPEFASLPPQQIVARLADQGTWLASESTFYRLLKDAEQQHPRGRSRPPVKRALTTHVADGPNQLWCWDITWLPTTVKGRYFYWYMIKDVYSRKLVANEVHESESAEQAAQLLRQACLREQRAGQPLVLHSDNGSAMKGSTMLAAMQNLGVMPSFSRPRVSNDNAYAEALFRTAKYCPLWPERPFDTLEQARNWVNSFVAWYNHEHRHSALKFVTPAQRHTGQAEELLRKRIELYEAARARHPERWSGNIRNWVLAPIVCLNPEREAVLQQTSKAA